MRRSIMRAATSVTMMTATAVTTLDQSTSTRPFSTGIQPLLEVVQRPSPCEPVLERMPVGDLVLAELPAEQDLLVTAERREVDEPLVRVLDLGAEPVDSVHALGDSARLLADLRLHAGQLAGIEVAAVARDRRRQVRATGDDHAELAAMVDHLLDEGSHLLEGRIGLVGREMTRRHGPGRYTPRG